MVQVPPHVAAALRTLPRPRCGYVYDRAVLRERAATLRATLPGTVLLYAMKANGYPEVVRTLATALDGVEVASGGELALARQAGARQIAFSGPAKTDAELRDARTAGATVHVESAHELARVPAGTAVALRVNRAGGGLPGTLRMAGGPTPFGIDEADLPDDDRVIGYHLHAVSNNLDAAAHADFVRDAAAWATARLPDRLRYLNVGGGLGIDYTGGTVFDLATFAAGMRDARAALPDGARLVLEPGRWLTAPAGWYAAEVLDLKRNHGRWYAVLRGGTHHFRLPAAWGYSHPCAVLPVDEWPYGHHRTEVRDSTVDVVGELCTPKDVLARDHPVDRLRIGDVLVLGNAGAYGWDISHREFLRHPYPEFIVV